MVEKNKSISEKKPTPLAIFFVLYLTYIKSPRE